MPAAENTGGFVLGATAFRPEDATLRKFLWDDGKFLGRGAASWGLIILFYIIYYACLAAFWGCMLLVFFTTLEENKPAWITEKSIIGTNPGLGYRPMPPLDYVESTLVWFKLGGKASEWKSWSDRLEDFLTPYDNLEESEGRSTQDCPANQPWAKDGKACLFQQSELGNWCTKENNFGYQQGQPCVIIKLNKIYGWKPELYMSAAELPAGLNKTLPENIMEEVESKPADDPYFYKVWLTCEGENPADKENIGGIEYFPGPFMRSHFYPYENQPGYLQPLVAVKFHGPENGVLINIECKAWAGNIEHDRSERIGSVHFELLMD